MINKFDLLKQTFYKSKNERYCDGYKIIIETLSSEERKNLGIKDSDLQEFIKEGENYLYRVGKENGVFKTKSISIKNYEIIRKYYKYFGEEN